MNVIDEYALQPDPNEKPTWVLQRHSNDQKGETHIQIWFKHDGMKLSSSEIATMLAKALGSEVKDD